MKPLRIGLLIIDDDHNRAESKLKTSVTSAASSHGINIKKPTKHGEFIHCRDLNTGFYSSSLLLWTFRHNEFGVSVSFHCWIIRLLHLYVCPAATAVSPCPHLFSSQYNSWISQTRLKKKKRKWLFWMTMQHIMQAGTTPFFVLCRGKWL